MPPTAAAIDFGQREFDAGGLDNPLTTLFRAGGNLAQVVAGLGLSADIDDQQHSLGHISVPEKYLGIPIIGTWNVWFRSS